MDKYFNIMFKKENVLLCIISFLFIVAFSCRSKKDMPEQNTVTGITLYADSEESIKEAIDRLNAINNQAVTLVIKDGVYEDLLLTTIIDNTSSFHKQIVAEHDGKVLLKGLIYIKVMAHNVHIRGINFIRNLPYGSGTPFVGFVEAEHCSLQRCQMSEQREEKDDTMTYYVTFARGFNNEVSNCRFIDKKWDGAYIVMSYMSDKGAKGNHHKIIKNYFGPRSYTGKPRNTAIRLGGSGKLELETAHVDAGLLVKGNTFDNYDAYYETISVKSSGNVIEDNTFIGCNGYLSLRNASKCRVEGNKFLGKNEEGTRGVRIQGPDHIIQNNYFEELQGTAFWIWGGQGSLVLKPSAMKVMPKYVDTNNTNIKNNTVINCKNFIEVIFVDKIKNFNIPKNIKVLNNLIVFGDNTNKLFSVNSKVFQPQKLGMQENITFDNNIMVGRKEFKSDLDFLSKLKVEKDTKSLKRDKKSKLLFHEKQNVGFNQ